MSSKQKRSKDKNATKPPPRLMKKEIKDIEEENAIDEKGSFKLEPNTEDIDTPDRAESDARAAISDECGRLRSTAALSQNLVSLPIESKEDTSVGIPAAESSGETEDVKIESVTPPRSTAVLSDSPINTDPVNTAVENVGMPPLSIFIKPELEEMKVEEMVQKILPIQSDVEEKNASEMRQNLILTEPKKDEVENISPIDIDSEEYDDVEMSDAELLDARLDDESAKLRSRSQRKRKREKENANNKEENEKSSGKKDSKNIPLQSKTDSIKTRDRKIIRSMHMYENDKRLYMFETRCVDEDYPNFYYTLARDYLRMLRRTLGYHRFESNSRREHSFYNPENQKISVPFIVDKPNAEDLMDEDTLMRLDKHSFFLIKANQNNESESKMKTDLEKLESEGKINSKYKSAELKKAMDEMT